MSSIPSSWFDLVESRIAELGNIFGTCKSKEQRALREARYRVVTMVDESVIQEAGRRLADAAGSDARVILFGSHARGDARHDSDLDFLVIEPNIESRTSEFVRLRNALGELGVPVDLLVYRSSEAEKWGGFPGTVVYDALREGRVLVGG